MRLAVLSVYSAMAGMALLVGCGDSDNESGQTMRHVSAKVAKDLPTHQHALPEMVCPAILNMPPEQEARVRARGERQLAALLEAYRADPDQLVATTYSTSETGKVEHEELTVKELLETHLSTARELGADDDQYAPCFDRTAARLSNVDE